MNEFGVGSQDVLLKPDKPTVVAIAHNEALRLTFFLEHYRSLGVRQFIIVDNDSDDSTARFLERQSDVYLLRSSKSFRENKANWRQLICDTLLTGEWVLFPDIDELFVYPGWPNIMLDGLTRYLDAQGFDCLFATMVDMYPKGGLANLKCEPGTSLIEACPFFDLSGYRFVPLKGAGGRDFRTPSRHVFGGTRERLFHHVSKREKHIFDRFLLSTFFRLKSSAPKSDFWRYIDQRLFKLIKDCLPGVDPLMSKVPLVKWRKGLTFPGAQHNIVQEMKLAPDWGALLHFKYLNDFGAKVEEALQRQEHSLGSRFYKDYSKHVSKVMSEGAYFEGSTKFTGVASLLDVGLARQSRELSRYLDEHNKAR